MIGEPLPAVADDFTPLPLSGGTVKDAPAEVTLKFNERLEPAFSSAVIRDGTGKQVDKADRTVVRVSVPSLAPGVYSAEWRVMSSDSHKVNGNFTFKVDESRRTAKTGG